MPLFDFAGEYVVVYVSDFCDVFGSKDYGRFGVSSSCFAHLFINLP